MKNFEKIKDEICFYLVNRKANQEMLKKHPHIDILDLAILFYCKQGKELKPAALTIICERDRKRWGVSVEKLYEVAKENTPKILPPIFQTIEQVIGDLAQEENLLLVCEDEIKEQMYVLTNEEKYFGAGSFLYSKILETISQRLKGAFFILPSSIHECIIMPDIGSINAANLQSLVTEMNEQFLDAEEVLSNQIYRYDQEKAKLMLI